MSASALQSLSMLGFVFTRFWNNDKMSLAETRLEVLQVRKLVQCVRTQDSAQIAKMAEQGVYGLLNYQGE